MRGKGGNEDDNNEDRTPFQLPPRGGLVAGNGGGNGDGADDAGSAGGLGGAGCPGGDAWVRTAH